MIIDITDLDSHVQTSSNPGSLQRLGRSVLLPQEPARDRAGGDQGHKLGEDGRKWRQNDDDEDDDDVFNDYIHEPRHLLLCQGDRLAAPVGQGDVGHLVRNLSEKKLNMGSCRVFEKQLHQQQNKMEMSSVVKSNCQWTKFYHLRLNYASKPIITQTRSLPWQEKLRSSFPKKTTAFTMVFCKYSNRRIDEAWKYCRLLMTTGMSTPL